MKRKYILVIPLLLLANISVIGLFAQDIYKIDASKVSHQVRKGHLNLGGESVTGETFVVNSFYIERNGHPFMPVIGEFHYSRYPNQYWDEEIKKIKAGGISVLATYVFWNLHEPKEGQFSWSGDLNLRRFIELCKANDMDVIVRVGPFDHGEMRNGGIPDWLYGMPFEIRSNDEAYLNYVEVLYEEISQQLQGLFFNNGGPIIGVQLENEYQHSAAPWAITYEGAKKEYTAARMDRKITQVGVGINEMGNDNSSYGQLHMQTLKKIAIESGLVAPIYTATGWGYASIVENGSIPVMSAYAYPFWEPGNKPSPFYLFKNLHKNPDYSPVSYVPEDYPSLAAEIGTGMSVTYSRRPRVRGESFLPMMVRMLGSGSNGLGYYMYHGGTTPSDGFFMYSEGSGLNLKSYDYQAPIGEFGSASIGFYGLKVINSFAQNFGDILAPLYPVLPETNASIDPKDTKTLRYAVRSDGEKGFLFMQNFQDHVETSSIENIRVHIRTKEGEIQFPEEGSLTLESGASAVFPYNISFDGVAFKYATVQPLYRFTNSGKRYNVFFSINGISPEIVLKGKQDVNAKGVKVFEREGNTIVVGANGTSYEFECNSVNFLVIPFEKALNAYLTGPAGQKRLVVSDALVLEDSKSLQMVKSGNETWSIEVFPKGVEVYAQNATILPEKSNSPFNLFSVGVEKVTPDIKVTQYDDRHFVLEGKKLDLTKLNDIYVKFDYKGDRVLCMLNGNIVTDNLYTSKAWHIGLKRYRKLLDDNEMYFYFYPMKKDAPYMSYLDEEVIPDFSSSNEFLDIGQPEIIPEYKVVFVIK